jgi:hypothetical protein
MRKAKRSGQLGLTGREVFWRLRIRMPGIIMPPHMDVEGCPSGSRSDGMDAKSHYEEFRAILKPFVEDILSRHPEVAWGRWEFECYRSFAVFEAYFPNSERRATMLGTLAATERRIEDEAREASEAVRGLGDW